MNRMKKNMLYFSLVKCKVLWSVKCCNILQMQTKIQIDVLAKRTSNLKINGGIFGYMYSSIDLILCGICLRKEFGRVDN